MILRPVRKRIFRLLVIAALALAAGREAAAQEVSAPEYQVKAAFLYNFAKLAEWPTNAFARTNAPFIIAVIGKDPFGKILEETVKDKLIDGRRVIVEHFRRAAELGECHVLFISDSERDHLAEIRAQLAGRPVLTVGETDGFARLGGVIGFIKQDSRVRFEINPEEAQAVKLKLSSRLLRLAIVVVPKPR